MEWHGLSHNAQLYLAARILQAELNELILTLFLNTTDAMLYFDRERRIFNLNKQFTELFGYTLRSCKEYATMASSLRNGNTVCVSSFAEKPLPWKQFVSANQAADPRLCQRRPGLYDGELKGGFAVYTDISERKAYEEHQTLKPS